MHLALEMALADLRDSRIATLLSCLSLGRSSAGVAVDSIRVRQGSIAIPQAHGLHPLQAGIEWWCLDIRPSFSSAGMTIFCITNLSTIQGALFGCRNISTTFTDHQ